MTKYSKCKMKNSLLIYDFRFFNRCTSLSQGYITTCIDRMFREFRRKTNVNSCFENRKNLNNILIFFFDFINELLGNA